MLIEPFDAATAPEAALRGYAALVAAIEVEELPGDPPPPYEEVLADLRNVPNFRVNRYWLAWDDDRTQVLGAATVSVANVDSNKHLADANIAVRPEARGHGLATALAERVVEGARAEQRTTIMGWALEGGPGDGFLGAFGAENKLQDRRSRLVLADIDRGLLESWVERAAERAAGYDLLTWEGGCPDELVDPFIALKRAENDAPRGDLDFEDEFETPERLREREAQRTNAGYTTWTAAARERETGELGGYTEVLFGRYRPHLAWQEWTAVSPAHRNRGLGRWVKAVNCLRLLDERPEAKYVDTWNASSNRSMLGINEAMGFQPLQHYGTWQIKTDDLAKAVEKRLG